MNFDQEDRFFREWQTGDYDLSNDRHYNDWGSPLPEVPDRSVPDPDY